jgi:hypothetical protein
METYVVRVWMPDRPGALGQVASRIGAVRGDVVGIDILERGGGRAIDELAVRLPSSGLVDLLVAEIRAVDGVDVEDVRHASDTLPDPRLDALETAALLVAAGTADELLGALVDRTRHDLVAGWVAVVDLEELGTRASVGDAPSAPWLQAFVEGSRSSATVAAGESGPDDVAWAALPAAHLHVVLGRTGRPLRARERRQLAAVARIADARWSELVGRDEGPRARLTVRPA